MIRTALVLALAMLALVLGACGGDDDGSSGSGSAQVPATEDGSSTATGTGSGSDGTGPQGDGNGGESGSSPGARNGGSDGRGQGDGRRGSQKKSNGDVPPLELDDKSPAPQSGARPPSGSKDLPSGAPKPKSDFKGFQLQIYESSRYFCARAGVDGMREEYGIDTDNPEDIAREAARRNYPRGFPDAVYSGCLVGLRQSG